MNNFILLRAYILAATAHSRQIDKAGKPYIKHPVRVAKHLTKKKDKVVALLHDVVEDTSVTIDEIEDKFGVTIAYAVDCLTKKPGEKTGNYLLRVACNKIATKVKIADLIDNIDILRLNEVTCLDVERTERYLRELKYLVEVYKYGITRAVYDDTR